MRRYPADCEEELILDETPLKIRPIRADDLAEELRFVHELSPDTAYHRFFSPVRELSAEMAWRFTHVDYHSTMALIALDRTQSPANMVGVARYAATAGASCCEFAVTIADRWQHRGLGLVLMQRLITYARRKGYSSMVGAVMQDNMGMRQLATRLGFRAHTDPEDPATLQMRLALDAEEKVATAAG